MMSSRLERTPSRLRRLLIALSALGLVGVSVSATVPPSRGQTQSHPQPSSPVQAGCLAQVGYGIDAPHLQAGRDYVAGQLLVGLHHWPDEGQTPPLALPQGGRVANQIADLALLLEFPNEPAAQAAIRDLCQDPNVSCIERNGFVSIASSIPASSPSTESGQPDVGSGVETDCSDEACHKEDHSGRSQ